MSFVLELRKIKRTGFLPAFLGGGILAGAVPACNMALRSERYTGLNASPVTILLDANWQMMAMLNILLVVAGACILYHTEYEDNAMQKMCTLPVKESAMFFGKAAMLIAASLLLLTVEGIFFFGCLQYWFHGPGDLYWEALKSFGFSLLAMLPAILFSLVVASVNKNLWISLGIGVICVFAATMLPARNFVGTLFPFALPFRLLGERTADYAAACLVEAALAAMLETAILKVRRAFS